MANETEGLVASSVTQPTQSNPIKLKTVAGLVILGTFLYRSGYKLGVRTAKAILKRHDKDVRIIEKKMKKQYENYDLVKKEKPKKRWFSR